MLPSSLLTMYRECAYCRTPLIEEAHSVRVSRLFGIIHCSDHATEASRDIYSYMNKMLVVRMQETYTHPKLQPLFDILRSGVSIRRSSGILDPDWQLLDDPYDSLNLIKKHNGIWLCPMKKEHMHKDVPLETLFAEMEPDSKHRKHLATALRALSDGIYSGN